MRAKSRAPSKPPASLYWVIFLAGGLLVGWLLPREGKQPMRPEEGKVKDALRAPVPVDLPEELALGEKLSEQVCSACHLRPSPEVLDRTTWAMEVLPGMEEWLGMNPGGKKALRLEPRVKAANLIPDSPAMSVEEWRAICAYYLANAPDRLPLADNRPKIELGLKHFDVQLISGSLGGNATMLKIDEQSSHIYYGESKSNNLVVMDRKGAVDMEVSFSSPPVGLQFVGKDLYMSLMGSYTPSDELTAKVMRMGNPYQGQRGIEPVLTGLPRSAGLLAVDINRDGLMDIVNLGYGNVLGRFSWFEARRDGTYEEHIIIDRCGAASAKAADIDGDGWPDLVVAMAQAREGIYLCMNKKGRFEVTPVAEMQPAWGTATLELADVDQDGDLDIIACNGDNGDFTGHLPPFRPYHGLRIYRNEGQAHFKEAFFMPIDGCYKAMAADFDLDGDVDLAVISFYPDYRRAPYESFMYLENVGPMQYKAYSFKESLSGRWITMDVGDLDKDGAPDIVLAAHNSGPTFVPGMLQEGWNQRGSSLVILHNTIKTQKR